MLQPMQLTDDFQNVTTRTPRHGNRDNGSQGLLQPHPPNVNENNELRPPSRRRPSRQPLGCRTAEHLNQQASLPVVPPLSPTPQQSHLALAAAVAAAAECVSKHAHVRVARAAASADAGARKRAASSFYAGDTVSYTRFGRAIVWRRAPAGVSRLGRAPPPRGTGRGASLPSSSQRDAPRHEQPQPHRDEPGQPRPPRRRGSTARRRSSRD